MRNPAIMRLTLVIGILVSFFSLQAFAAVNVTIDRNLIRLNESFQLVFEADSSPDEAPDFSALEQYFRVINQSQSNNISIINGEYQRNIKWVLQLMPTQVGDFIIPAIAFGNDKTRPFQIRVKPANQAAAGSQDELIFDLSVDKTTMYVQAQVVVTLRLMVDRNISGYQMSDLTINNLDVVVEPLGEVKQYQTRLGDKNYLVLEKQIGLFPQQSGWLEIEPVVAEVQDSKRSSSIFGSFPNGGNLRRVVSQGATIDVLTIASDSRAKHWLPAKKITLTEDWANNATHLVAGEPVTRTITVVADGLTSAQLPELEQTQVDGIKRYPDKPLLQDQKAATGIVGTRQQKIALIPTEAGRYTLPEVIIDWWNVDTGQQEQAKIPSRSIEVIAAAGSRPPNDNTQQPLSTGSGRNNTAAALTPQTGQGSLFWVWLSLALAIGWIGTVLIWWYRRRQLIAANQTESERLKADRLKKTARHKAALKQLSQSCTSNHARDTRDNLLLWANSLDTDQSFDNLNQLGRSFGNEFQAQIDELNQSLYGAQEGAWQGNGLLRSCESISAYMKTSRSTDNDSSLSALNPQ